jgi:hypothetical protein
MDKGNQRSSMQSKEDEQEDKDCVLESVTGDLRQLRGSVIPVIRSKRLKKKMESWQQPLGGSAAPKWRDNTQ